MSEILTSAQMRAIERAAIDAGEATGLELMERAGRGVVEAVFAAWPELAKSPHHAVVLCGPGNNGGDGFVIARLLKQWGWEVALFLYGDLARLPPDAKVNHRRWCALGAVRGWEEQEIERLLETAGTDLVIDALFGTGLTRPVTLAVPALAGAGAGGRRPRVVAVDLPSGLCSDSGRVIGRDRAAVVADLTVSFHALKLGHVLARGPELCGTAVVADIGLPDRGDASPAATARLVGAPTAELGKRPAAHKYAYGHALVLAGGMGRTGAARLAARGALRVGAGLVTVAARGEAMMECAAQLTAIMLRRCDDCAGLADLLNDARLNALCLGPGLGIGDAGRGLVETALQSGRACVLDADALTMIAGDRALFAGLHENCVLTPHAGEFARLFPDIAERLTAPATTGPAFSKVDAARAAAARAGCVLLFKGPDTVVAAPDGRCSVNPAQYDRAAPWLATAGAGDVLAGFIAGLLARGADAMPAAETAAWLHVECALAFGPGLIAEDIPETLPGVFRDLGVRVAGLHDPAIPSGKATPGASRPGAKPPAASAFPGG